ncbi:hypothetical protein LCGC14_1495310 [marine sediment metagenome]|uniref:HTH luxR-type domain-containing protein n=1 Tax=marine sediment metagenome TaxID=412755 RepID=A0A0F9LL49_9ZZZZ
MTKLSPQEREVVILSPRQLEVLTLVGKDGESYKATAQLLGISLSTVRTYVARIVEQYPYDKTPRMALTEIYFRHVDTTPRPPKVSEQPPGFVYAIATTERPKRLKIGYSTDVQQRLHELSLMSPVGLCLLASWPGSLEDEAKMHEAAKDHRLHGEWFSMEAFEVIRSVMPSDDS